MKFALLLVSIASWRLDSRNVERVCFMESYASSSSLDGIFLGTATDGIAAVLTHSGHGSGFERGPRARAYACEADETLARRGRPRREMWSGLSLLIDRKGILAVWCVLGLWARVQAMRYEPGILIHVEHHSRRHLATQLRTMLAMSTTSACIARPVARVSVAAARSTRAAATVGVKTVHVGVKIHGTSAMNFAARGRASVVTRAEEETKAGATTADDDEMPPWERRELMKKAAMEKGGLPWPAYLGLAVIVAIASIGSCFELNYGNPIFGVVGPDSFLYKPILYWFIGTGFPLAAFLWTKGIAGANEAAELQDELDGY